MKNAMQLFMAILLTTSQFGQSALAQDTWTLPGAVNPQNSYGQGLAYIGSDKVLQFGFLGETWVYDLSDNVWTNMNPPSGPTGRGAQVMVHIGGDKVLLFGGTDDFINFLPNNQTWVYDLSDNAWTLLTPAQSPSARLSTAMAYAGGDHTVLYGGDAGWNETWLFDLSASTWTLMNPAVNPGPQASHAMASLDGDRALLFSGSAGGDLTWVYDLSDNTWTSMLPGTEPSPRAISAMTSLGGDRVLLFGGLEFFYGDVNDTWVYDYGDNLWTLLTPAYSPSEREGQGMAFITTDHVLMYGNLSTGDVTTYLFTASPEPCPVETCDGLDNDCDGLIDEGVKTTYFLDSDGDGFGNPTSSVEACEQPNGYAGTGTDCNDSNGLIYPDATEIPDGKDNDCDGLVDEGFNILNVDAGDCVVVFKGYAPAQCQTLSVSVSGGTPPYTYLWSNGAVTSCTTVCPASTTLYTVTVTDQNGSTAKDKVTVQVIDVRCGNNNDKVVVCHSGQVICVAASAVPAHLGHGDYLGLCDVTDPCGDAFYSAQTTSFMPLPDEAQPAGWIAADIHDRNESVLIAPNPADEAILITLPEAGNQAIIRIWAISGRTVFENTVAEKTIRLSTTAWPDGSYILQLITPTETKVQQLIIAHQ